MPPGPSETRLRVAVCLLGVCVRDACVFLVPAQCGGRLPTSPWNATAILAAANPVGSSYDNKKSVVENLNLNGSAE